MWNLSVSCVNVLRLKHAAVRNWCLEWGNAGAGQDVEQWLRLQGLCFLTSRGIKGLIDSAHCSVLSWCKNLLSTTSARDKSSGTLNISSLNFPQVLAVYDNAVFWYCSPFQENCLPMADRTHVPVKKHFFAWMCHLKMFGVSILVMLLK